MKDETKSLIKRARDHIMKKEFKEAGSCFEQAAAAEDDKAKARELYIKAAEAYHECRSISDTARCYLKVSELSQKEEKAEWLMKCFRLYILEIAGTEWECCFEFRGDAEEHALDHEINQEFIRKYRNEAEKFLQQALSIEGVNKNKIVKEAVRECKKREKEGGWGSGRCWAIVTAVTGRKRRRSMLEILSGAVDKILDHLIRRSLKRSRKKSR